MTGAEYAGLAAVQNDKVFANPHGFFDWQYTAPTVALNIMGCPDITSRPLANIDIRQEINIIMKLCWC